MTHAVRLLALMLTLTCAAAWAGPAEATRLASVNGTAGAEESRGTANFRLDGQTALTVNYDISKTGDPCTAQVRIYRKQNNGDWLVVNRVHTTQQSSRGNTAVTLPAGDYRIEVVAKQAKYTVTVDN